MAKKQRLPTYRHHPNGQAFFEYQGKRTYLGKYDSPQSRQKFAQAMAQVIAGGPGALVDLRSGFVSIDEAILAYLDHATKYYRTPDGEPSKEFKGMARALEFLSDFCGCLDGGDLGPAKLIAFQQHLVGLTYPKMIGRKGAGQRTEHLRYARSFINKVVNRVKRFVRWACKNEKFPPEQFSKIDCVDALQKGRCSAVETEDIEPVDRAIVEQTLPYLTPTVRAMVQTQMLCGMRPAEVCIMRGIDIAEHDPIWIYEVPEHKNKWRGQDLFKAIPRVVQQIIRPFMCDDMGTYVFSPKRSEEMRVAALRKRPAQKRPPRKKPHRDRYDTDSYRRGINYGIAKAARAGIVIPHWHPNQLRHTIATEIRQSLGEEASQVWLGHACIETTGIYAAKQITELVAVAQLLDRHWAKEHPQARGSTAP